MSVELSAYAESRDPQLRDELAERHLPLVKFVARKMSANLPESIELDDLVSWGCLGLLDALDKFDPGRQVKFSTYAVTRIRGAILDGLQQMDWAPKQVTSKVRAMRRLREVLTAELGRAPSPAELAYRMDCSTAEIRTYLLDDETTRLRPLQRPTDGGEGETYRERDDMAPIEADQEVAGEVAEIRDRLATVIATLPARERSVMMLYYDQGLTLREIASQLGISVSSATQTHTRLVEHLRSRLAGVYGPSAA